MNALSLGKSKNEKIEVPIIMSGAQTIINIDDVNTILFRCGEEQLDPTNIKPDDEVVLNYSFEATYCGDLPDTLAIIKKLADEHGARAVGQIKMYLLNVLHALEGV